MQPTSVNWKRSHVTDEKFDLPVRRSHIIQDAIRGMQRVLFSPQKALCEDIIYDT